MKIKARTLLAALALSVCFAANASANLTTRINGIISQSSQRKARFSIHVVKADSGRTVYAHNAREALIPASNMKIIITAAALKYLGPDYQYKTQVGLCGDTLAVIGSGDPLLGDERTDKKYGRKVGWIFDDIAAKLKENGVQTVNDIVVDSSIFDDQRAHPNWPKEQLNQWYACEVSGLNYNDNCIEMTAKNKGGRISVTFEPKTDFITIVNKVSPTSKGNSAVGAYRNQQPNKLIVKGKCNKQAGPFYVAIERPPAFFGYMLAENLIKVGISTRGQLTERAVAANSNFRQLAEYTTPISDCLNRSNKNSLGLVAEALLKTMAAQRHGGRNGSWQGGCDVISQYLRSLGISDNEFYIDDGSGLSRKNKLSANTITKVLQSVYKSRNRQLYYDSLSVGGTDGTIRKRFNEQKYRGKIRGKTGYITGVRCLSGICTGSGGDYIFSILKNGSTRKAIDDIVKAIIDSK